jgi:hypothetical protein
MPFDMHTVEVPDGSNINDYSKVILGSQLGIANAAGGTAGASVTTAVTFGGLPPTYMVHVTPSQACFVSVTNKTAFGFNVVLTPTGSGVTLAAGTFDVSVLG